jgi:hypothetical protein
VSTDHGEITEEFDLPESPNREYEHEAGRRISEALDDLFGTEVRWAITGEHLVPVHTHADGHTCKVPMSFTLDNTRDDEISIDLFEAAAEHLRHEHLSDLLGELSESDKNTLRELLGSGGMPLATASVHVSGDVETIKAEIEKLIGDALTAEGIEYTHVPPPPGVHAIGILPTHEADYERGGAIIKRVVNEYQSKRGGEDAPQAALGQDKGNGGYL